MPFRPTPLNAMNARKSTSRARYAEKNTVAVKVLLDGGCYVFYDVLRRTHMADYNNLRIKVGIMLS